MLNSQSNQNPQRKLITLYDYHNLEAGFRAQKKELNMVALREYFSFGREAVEHVVYIGTNPLDIEGSIRQLIELRRNGFIVRTKTAKVLPGNKLKCNLDVELVIDALDMAERVSPDIILIASGDGDFTPLVEKLRFQGIRTEVASVKGTISRKLKYSANGYIDLTNIDLSNIDRLEENITLRRAS
ncbi:NYN domain-containing protein [Thermodesulfobacteriota bacterium]